MRSHHRLFIHALVSGLTALFVLVIIVTPLAAHSPAPNDAGQVLRIGLTPEKNLLEQRRRYRPLLDYLNNRVKVEFDIKNLFRHGDVINNFHKNKLDGAFFGSLTGTLAVSHLGIEPIARLQPPATLPSAKGLLIVRKKSNITQFDQTRNARMVFVDRATTAGYLLPLVYLNEHGIDNYRDWFSSFYFSGTYEDAVLEVLNGHADVGATKNTVFAAMAANDPRITEELTVLAELPTVPETTFGLRNDLPIGLKTLIKEALLTMHQTTEGRRILSDLGAHSFVAATTDDYQPVRAYAERIGIDLNTYLVSGCGGTDCTCRVAGCTSTHNSCARSSQ